MISPLSEAVARLRTMQAEALEPLAEPEARRLAALPALAAAMGLLASVLAADALQLETVRRLMVDLQAESEDSPARATALLALVMTRHLLDESEEAQHVAARLFRESDEQAGAAPTPESRAAARLGGAARLLLLSASWLDREFGRSREIGRADDLARGVAERPADEALTLAAEVTDLALELLCLAILPAEPIPAPASEPLPRAFERAAGLAERLAGGRGRG